MSTSRLVYKTYDELHPSDSASVPYAQESVRMSACTHDVHALTYGVPCSLCKSITCCECNAIVSATRKISPHSNPTTIDGYSRFKNSEVVISDSGVVML